MDKVQETNFTEYFIVFFLCLPVIGFSAVVKHINK
jgi:hypothetical protein